MIRDITEFYNDCELHLAPIDGRDFSAAGAYNKILSHLRAQRVKPDDMVLTLASWSAEAHKDAQKIYKEYKHSHKTGEEASNAFEDQAQVYERMRKWLEQS